MATYQEVRAAVAEWMGRNGSISMAADLAYQMADGMGVSERSRGDMQTFMAQVRRALEELVESGELLRDYNGRGSYANYRTPAAEAVRRQDDRHAAAVADRLRRDWDEIAARIDKLGVPAKTAGPVISLDLDGWDQLLQLAERSS